MTGRGAYLGCLLGGAIGDALGFAVEFMTLPDIRARLGAAGVTDLDAQALISDDTQMTLFTAEGLLRAGHSDMERAVPALHAAYLRWLGTQMGRGAPEPGDGGLMDDPRLYARRAPGHTCISALMSGRVGAPDAPLNNSKGCGGVMRAAPCGLQSHADAFELGCRAAAITHSHPSGYLSAGALAHAVRRLVSGATMEEAVLDAARVLKTRPHHEETLSALTQAIELKRLGDPTPEKVETLGGGWVGEEALAIAVYAALCHPRDARAALLLSVNHSGDSDSTGAICGSLIGASLGADALPEEWRARVELSDLCARCADALYELTISQSK